MDTIAKGSVQILVKYCHTNYENLFSIFIEIGLKTHPSPSNKSI